MHTVSRRSWDSDCGWGRGFAGPEARTFGSSSRCLWRRLLLPEPARSRRASQRYRGICVRRYSSTHCDAKRHRCQIGLGSHTHASMLRSRCWTRRPHNVASVMQSHSCTPARAQAAHLAHRAEALASHEEAAARILAANNVSTERGPWELDLHGLHASEAVAALDHRLGGPWPVRVGARVRVRVTVRVRVRSESGVRVRVQGKHRCCVRARIMIPRRRRPGRERELRRMTCPVKACALLCCNQHRSWGSCRHTRAPESCGYITRPASCGLIFRSAVRPLLTRPEAADVQHQAANLNLKPTLTLNPCTRRAGARAREGWRWAPGAPRHCGPWPSQLKVRCLHR